MWGLWRGFASENESDLSVGGATVGCIFLLIYVENGRNSGRVFACA